MRITFLPIPALSLVAPALCAAFLTTSPLPAQPANPFGNTSGVMRQAEGIRNDSRATDNASNPSPSSSRTKPAAQRNKPAAVHPAPSKTTGKADMGGTTPLHMAAYQGDASKLQALLDTPGVLVDAPEKRGMTPLMLAAGAGRTESVKMLLARGANPNLKNGEGSTALHRASGEGDLASVQALLKGGADPTIVDSHGRTPQQLAEHNRKGEWSDVSDRLKRATAK